MAPLLSALKFAPAVFSAGLEIYEAVTGKESRATTPEQLAADVHQLQGEQYQAAFEQILAAKVRHQELDTQRFSQLTDGDAERIRATARPEIALRAMRMMELFSQCFQWLVVATIIHWFAAWFIALFNSDFVMPSLWAELAKAHPVAELIWAPLLASFYAAIEVIKKYMGCRERDKAQQYEIQHGKPLQSAAATVEAAGGAVARLIKAFKK